MKIGLFNDSFPPKIDGVANAVYNYAKYINKNHGEAIVVTPWYPKVKDNYTFKVYRYSSFSSFDYLPYRLGNPISPITLAELASEKMDLMHIHSPFASSLLVQQQKLFQHDKKPVVLTYHTKFDIDIDKYIKEKVLNRFAKKFVLRNINLADEVWCVTDGAGKWLRETGYQGDYIVMPNGTDFPKGAAPADAVAGLKKQYTIPSGVPVFLFCARMMWYKNVRILLDALKIIQENSMDFRCLMVGDGVDREEIEAYAAQIGLVDRVWFTGAITDREEVRNFFSAADLFLFPSTFDTSGLVVKEAAACACPSLLIRGSCAAEGITDGTNGFLAEENAEDFAAQILRIIRTEGLLQRAGAAAQQSVYCSWEDAVAAAYRRYEIVAEQFARKQKKK